MNKKEPLVLCLTNTVAANFTANCLLAIGAKPAMIEEPSEAAELAAVADAMLVNLGTVTARQADTMRAAITSANEYKTPWVLDPVAIQTLSFRRKLAEEFIALGPTLIRGNHAEIEIVRKLASETVMLSTGETDRICGEGRSQRSRSTVVSSNLQRQLQNLLSHMGGPRSVAAADGTEPVPPEVLQLPLQPFEPSSISGGTPLLQSVTATGCAQGAICAAFLGWGQSPEEAALSASKLMKSAGERAAAKAKAPGSFQIALLDELFILTHQ